MEFAIVENCRPSETCTQRQTLKCSKPPAEINKKTSELELLEKDRDREICEEAQETDEPDDVLNLCHGRGEHNGTNLTIILTPPS